MRSLGASEACLAQPATALSEAYGHEPCSAPEPCLVEPEDAVGEPHAQQPQLLVQVGCCGGCPRLAEEVPLQQLPVAA